MGTRDKDQTTPHHQPHISSLVVRPSVSDGGEPGGGGGRSGAGSDYEPGEVRRDRPPPPRSDRYKDEPGYRTRPGSTSPSRRRDAAHRYGVDIDHSGGPSCGREFGSGRGSGRHRDYSPLHSRGTTAGRPFDRGLDGPGYGPPPFRGNGIARNSPNVRPREGDWICPDPLCGNLNFARREYCNSCKRHRYGSPSLRGYPGTPPPPLAPTPRRLPGPPMDLSPRRTMNGYRSPPRAWGRDGPRDFGPGGPPLRHDPLHRDRLDFPEDDYRGRGRFERPVPVDWPQRDHRGREGLFGDRKGYDRRPPSPLLPLAPPRGRWSRDLRERSRSPIRGPPPLKNYSRDVYAERGREDRRPMARDRIGRGAY